MILRESGFNASTLCVESLSSSTKMVYKSLRSENWLAYLGSEEAKQEYLHGDLLITIELLDHTQCIAKYNMSSIRTYIALIARSN